MLRCNLLIALAPAWPTAAPLRPLPHDGASAARFASVESVSPGALERVAVIGASASAGFLLPTDLGEALGLLMLCEHEPVLSVASSRFFLQPDYQAELQVVKALAVDATAVVAIDFLFWFTYGAVGSDDNRARLLERGLDYLESFDCPLITSTVPDMSAAVGKMLWPSQVPSRETLDALNRRIEAWAIERPNVVLVSLPEWHAQLLARERFELAGKAWPPTPDAPLLQYDELHPNVDGLALLACKVLENLIAGGADIDPAAVELDPALVARPIHARLSAIVERR